MPKKISIIVPVYNGENYIHRCVGSILSQEGFDINALEILLLNDGSSDNSFHILKQYEQGYPKIVKAIDHKNVGAAKTRNMGIKLATGKYTIFVDQDDYIDTDYCRVFYDAIQKGNYDVVRGGFKLVDTRGRIVRQKMPIDSDFGKFLSIPAWAKIHSTQFLKENGIEFFNNNIGEDNVFTVKEIIKAKKYGLLKYAGYNNSFENSLGVTNTLHKGLSENVNIQRLLEELLKLRTTNPELNAMISYNNVRTVVYYLLSYGRQATPERFYATYRELFGWLEANISKHQINTYLVTSPKGEKLLARISVMGFILIHRVHFVGIFAKLYCEGRISG